jgi:Flp pilus assembly protein TadG
MRLVAQDQRGVTALAFAVMALGIIGFVGFAAETGSWYMTRRSTQNAADSAAMSAAMSQTYVISYGADQSSVNDTATGQEAANGYASGATSLGTVQLSAPVSTAVIWPQNCSGGACVTPQDVPVSKIAITVQEAMTQTFSFLFGASAARVGATSSAVVVPSGNACVLALSGTLTVSGAVSSNTCGLASNAVNMLGIDFQNPGGALPAITTVGDCPRCDEMVNHTDVPPSPHHPPTIDPYVVGAPGYGNSALMQADYAATTLTMPWQTTPGVACADPMTDDVFGPAVPASSFTLIYLHSFGALVHGVPFNKVYCKDLDLSTPPPAGTLHYVVEVDTGAYFFANKASIKVPDGSEIICIFCSSNGGNGTSFVFTDATPDSSVPPGILPNALTITNGAAVALVAQQANAIDLTLLGDQQLAGVLFFSTSPPATARGASIDLGSNIDLASVNTSNPGGNLFPITGAIYFPNAPVSFGATGSVLSPCTSVIAASITLADQTRLNSGACGSSFNFLLPAMQTARLVPNG